MRKITNELVRITTEDGLELHGLLFEPYEESTKALIHIHGWVGNSYENKFIDNIAKKTVSEGFAFLTFNNRGAGIVSDFIKREKLKIEYIRIGGSLEKFEECIFDIKAAIDFLISRGYKDIILQGHSLGCQKITFYKYKTKDNRIKGLILIAPVDDVDYAKRALGQKYKESLKIAKEMFNQKSGHFLPKWMEFYPLMTAERFLDIADPKTISGRLFDYQGNLKEIQNVNCPVLAIFGSEDDYQDKPSKKLEILKNKVDNCDIELIEKSGHGFVGFEVNLAEQIGKWIKNI